MKILHFSHTGTPDNRIERYAYMQKKDNHDVYLCGESSSQSQQRFPNLHIFNQFFICPASLKVKAGIYYFFSRYKDRFEKIYKNLKPDILHAHDLIAAKACSDLKLPFIYDDHEYWSKQVRSRFVNKWHHKITNQYLKPLYDRWERDVLRDASAVIAVAETQAQEHQARCSQVYTMPNYPISYEIEKIGPLNQTTSPLAIVIVTKGTAKANLRWISKLYRLIDNQNISLSIIGSSSNTFPKANQLSFLPHMELIKYLPRFHLGIIAFHQSRLKSGYFKYYSPNRIFLYAHCGITPLLHDKMEFLKTCFGSFALTVDSSSEIPDVLQQLVHNELWLQKQPKRLQIKAQEDFVWDKQYQVVKKAYNCL